MDWAQNAVDAGIGKVWTGGFGRVYRLRCPKDRCDRNLASCLQPGPLHADGRARPTRLRLDRTKRRRPTPRSARSPQGDARIYAGKGCGPGIRFNEHIEGDGSTVFAHACKMGLEGIVSKRKGSPYRSGRSPDWLKMKNPDAPAVTARGGGRLGHSPSLARSEGRRRLHDQAKSLFDGSGAIKNTPVACKKNMAHVLDCEKHVLRIDDL
jgi:hypothetical protein